MTDTVPPKASPADVALTDVAAHLTREPMLGQVSKPVNRQNLSASAIDWKPLQRGGANFRTHCLHDVAPDRLEFRASGGLRRFCLVFIVAGLALSGLFVSEQLAAGPRIDQWLPVLFPLLFVLAGVVMWWLAGQRRVFDLTQGYYWRGKGRVTGPEALNKQKDVVALAEIRALQLLEERVHSDDASYYSFELNLVLAGGRRINVIDHGSRASVVKDVTLLGQRLGVPVWDRS
ncbi:MAG: hypothetical protein MI794_18470 [Pseudomonadales bacterium]|nr:hypothetical protein [Pseudomonadales bacterium]